MTKEDLQKEFPGVIITNYGECYDFDNLVLAPTDLFEREDSLKMVDIVRKTLSDRKKK